MRYEKKVRILAVAPYAEMKPLLEEAALSRTDRVEMTICVGDWKEGLQRAREMMTHQAFDILLSRGGTARLLQNELLMPVAEIPFSILDMLRDIKRFEHYAGKLAVVGVSAVTENAKIVCDILQLDIRIVTVKPSDDIEKVICTLKKDGCTLAICDLVSYRAAQRSSLHAIFSSSSVESIQRGIDDAIHFVDSNKLVYQSASIYKEALMHDDDTVILHSEQRGLVFSSVAKAKDGDILLDVLRKSPQIFLPESDADFLKKIKRKRYSIKRRVFSYGEDRYALLRISEKIEAFCTREYGTFYQEQDDLEKESSGGSSVLWGEVATCTEKYANLQLPVLILGEEGTGRAHMAYQLYRQSPVNKKPLFIVSCAEILSSNWERLLFDENSPFSALGIPFYFKDMDALGRGEMEAFIQYAASTEFFKRNRVIVSMTLAGESGRKLRTWLMEQGNAVTIVLPNLRERMDVFCSILALYTNELNQTLGKQIIGFESDALERMKGYDWPQNLEQLRRVMREAFLLTEGSYVIDKHIQFLLEEEEKIRNSFVVLDGTSLSLHGRTLDEMTYEIVQFTLKKEQGNKEKTAARLGIGRTTLWRILKNHKSPD